MLLEHRGRAPQIDPTAYVAPSAVVCGAVTIGPGARILHGAVLTAEDGEVAIGRDCVVMENAVVRGRSGHPARIGDSVLVGPHAHVNGADVGDEAFIATGASLFPGSRIGRAAEVRIGAVVQVNSTVDEGAVIPIGWVVVGSEAFPPDRHEEIWAVQKGLDFVGMVYGAGAGTSMREIMAGQSAFYGSHAHDTVIVP